MPTHSHPAPFHQANQENAAMPNASLFPQGALMASLKSAGCGDLESLVSPNLWRANSEEALILALRRSTFDGDAYLRLYPDVRKAGVDPAAHYVRNGHAEGRKALFRPAGGRRPAPAYTIVSACYNVAKYLDDFFASLERQTLDFAGNILCIMVDDGSSDATLAKLRQWQARYPDNITVLHKKNGGQASARNMGMELVRTPWVTFTDPDDFLDPDYFAAVDDALAVCAEPPCMVGTHLVFYREATGAFVDNHPLNHKFAEALTIRKVAELDDFIQLSASSSIFDAQQWRKNEACFDELVRPHFEDGFCIQNYLRKCGDSAVLFCAGARYYYRKREDSDSSIDNSMRCKTWYDDILRYGYLPLLTSFPRVPAYIINTVLYDLVWRVKALVNAPEKADFLTAEERERFLFLMDACFAHISKEAILGFRLAGCWRYWQLGMLHCFKQQQPGCKPTVYVEKFDPVKNQARLRYFSGNPDEEIFCVDKAQIQPVYAKSVRDDFLGRVFIYQRIVWLPLPRKADSTLTCKLGSADAAFFLTGATSTQIKASDIETALNIHPQPGPDAPWLFLDRETQADDNAEHLYRWARKHHPGRRCFFVLERSSHDWQRLEQEGFALVAFGSEEHRRLWRECAVIISSHIDGYVERPFADAAGIKPIVFLQHGVTVHDISRWLNSKRRLDMFVTSTPAEYASIAGNGNRYRFTAKEVRLTGFPRHDALLQVPRSVSAKKRLLVMPTWRQYLMGRQISGNHRERNAGFMRSKYARAWRSFLHSPALQRLAKTYACEVLFFPHPNIQPYIEDFAVPAYVRLKRYADVRIQNELKAADLIISDFSSMPFDMAYMEKAVLYYQFDEDDYYSGRHTVQKGYFDYRRDGFGPVCTDEASLLGELEAMLARGCRPEAKYLQRMRAAFPVKDGKNCERVYNAICDLLYNEGNGGNAGGLNSDLARFLLNNGR